jgi:SAM-dependent methyltransferase
MTHYYPNVFEVADERRAKEIILTNEGPGADTEIRWAKETPYVMQLITKAFELRSDMVVLDYGCGIGRMAKAMIEATGCSVIGMDISASMRALAIDYVQSDRFVAVSPGQFDILVASGLRVHAGIAVWVLQHCLAPAEDIARIRDSLRAGASLFVLNMLKRAIPVMADVARQSATFRWRSDGIDVAALLRSTFRIKSEGEPADPSVPNMADAGAFWMSLRI